MRRARRGKRRLWTAAGTFIFLVAKKTNQKKAIQEEAARLSLKTLTYSKI